MQFTFVSTALITSKAISTYWLQSATEFPLCTFNSFRMAAETNASSVFRTLLNWLFPLLFSKAWLKPSNFKKIWKEARSRGCTVFYIINMNNFWKHLRSLSEPRICCKFKKLTKNNIIECLESLITNLAACCILSLEPSYFARNLNNEKIVILSLSVKSNGHATPRTTISKLNYLMLLSCFVTTLVIWLSKVVR